MRPIIASAFVSLDGVMQAPGGPDEDPTHGFRFGGWTAPYWDDAIGAAMGELFAAPFELLLGRRTYDIFAAHWPFVELDPSKGTFDAVSAQVAETFNRTTKHVATHRPETLTWQHSRGLGPDVAASVRALAQQDGPTLLVQGSSELLHLLLADGLVDELRVLTYPVVLGRGKRLFDERVRPSAFRVASSVLAPSGVVITRYLRAGEVQTGSFALETPTPAELERRRALA